MSNPWIEKHMAVEMEFTGDGYTRGHARTLVEGEYAGSPNPEQCGCCGETAYYRATVGTLQCPSCGAIEYGVWIHKTTGEERRTMSASILDQYRLERRWSA